MKTSERPRLFFFIPNLDGGGAEKVIITIANEVSSRGFDTTLCVIDGSGPYSTLISPSILLIDLESTRLRSSLWSLIRSLQKRRPTVVYSTIMSANWLVGLAVKLSRIDARLVLREAISAKFIENDTLLRVFLAKTLCRIVYRWADTIVSVSQEAQTDLVEFLGSGPDSRFMVIYNPSNPKIPELTKDSVHWSAQMPESSLFAISMGRLSAQKDFTTLLKAMSVVQEHHDLGLIVLGEGEDRAKLEAFVIEKKLRNVYFPGFLENPYPVLSRASVFVLSSRYEGMPNALIDALSLGVPIVSTNCPTGPSEVLDGGKWGTLVAVGDSNAMAQAIVASLERSSDSVISSDALEPYQLGTVVNKYLSAAGLSEFP